MATTRDRRIWSVVADIPPGRIASYAQIAALAGLPRGARQVAPALKRAPETLGLPWHRVLRADGRIALPTSSAAYLEQVERLSIEGVEVVGGRVDRKAHGWYPSLDEQLWRL